MASYPFRFYGAETADWGEDDALAFAFHFVEAPSHEGARADQGEEAQAVLRS